MSEIDDMGRAVMSLFLELPEEIAKDVKAKWDAVYNIIEKRTAALENIEVLCYAVHGKTRIDRKRICTIRETAEKAHNLTEE